MQCLDHSNDTGNHGLSLLILYCLKWHIRLCFAVLLLRRFNTCLLFERAYTFCFHVRRVEIVGILGLQL